MKTKKTRFLLGGAMLALLASQAAAQKISNIATTKVADGLQIQISGDQLPAPKIARVMGGKSFTLEFDASLSEPQWMKVEHSGVHYVQSVWQQSNPPKVRVFLRVEPDTKLDVDKNDSGYLVKVSKDASAAATPAKQTMTSAPVNVQVLGRPNDADQSRNRVKVVPTASATVAAVSKGSKGKPLSLDFVNTDLVQILKALALQSGVNIVTSPDVKGNLTVSLAGVSVTEALDLVTSLAGVKYGKVGNTYVVASADKFEQTLHRMDTSYNFNTETRVVPLYSGEGVQIKQTLKQAAGNVDIMLPSEKPQAAGPVPGAVPGTDPAATAPGAGAQPTASGTTPAKDAYLVLLGPANKVSDVERQVRALDEQMCTIKGLEYPVSGTGVVRSVYHPKGNTAVNLMQALAGTSADKTAGGFRAKVGTVDMFATPPTSTSQQVLVLHGRENEVNKLLETLDSLDTIAQSAGEYSIYNVKYADPRSLREELIVQFPGLSVNIPPASAGNPNLFHSSAITDQATQKLGENQGQGTVATTGSDKQGGTATLAGDSGKDQGTTSPFAEMEKLAYPMKLVLRGSPEQIRGAMAYLDAIDTAPKQVALELRVMQLSREDALKVGLDWSILTGGTLQTFRINQGLGGTPSSAGTFSGTLGFAGGGLADILGTLDQLSDKDHLLARPNLLAMDGRQSELFVGDVVRYVESIQSTQNGTTVTTGEVPVGVRLAVLPRVGGDDGITMDLRPVVSTLNGFTSVPGGGQLPQTSLRVAQSTMQIQSGETIAIGGLIQDQDRKHSSGIPILKDIPILGTLFKRIDNDHRRTEIVFFLTAKVVDPSNRQNAANPMRGELERKAGGKGK